MPTTFRELPFGMIFANDPSPARGERTHRGCPRIAPYLGHAWSREFFADPLLSVGTSGERRAAFIVSGGGDCFFASGRADQYSLVMTPSPARDLESLISGERLAREHAIFIVIACCKAIARIETRGVVVPSCVMISETEVTIGDFDSARPDLGYFAPEFGDAPASKSQTRKIRRDGELIGMSSTWLAHPEFTVDRPRAAVFSLGCVLWELLAGRRLFIGASDYESMMLARAAHVPTIDIDPELESIVRKALAKNAEHRYETPAHLADALATALHPSSLMRRCHR